MRWLVPHCWGTTSFVEWFISLTNTSRHSMITFVAIFLHKKATLVISSRLATFHCNIIYVTKNMFFICNQPEVINDPYITLYWFIQPHLHSIISTWLNIQHHRELAFHGDFFRGSISILTSLWNEAPIYDFTGGSILHEGCFIQWSHWHVIRMPRSAC